ncbi:HNH endonuclease signature motif containing protein, partial [Phytoactinopolyspora endophytica]|uniref:HNH endonuclease signature motif containing protein n=1 Tax=Phytoactinopolyspora endophytica TaxID=1642495 RepID=UPI0013EC07F5
PGCHQPAYRCEIDHRVPYPQGPTSACNCSLLCKTCHLQKHRAGWTVEQLEPGVQRWTSPTGHQQIVRLPRVALPTPEPDPPPAREPTEPDIPPF